MAKRPLAMRTVLALAVAAGSGIVPARVAWAGLAAPQMQGEQAPLTVRLFIDLDCPHSRRAWPRFAALQRPGVAVVLHHLPLGSHALAQVAAQAAVAARLQNRELPFVQALMAEPKPDDAAILRAAEVAGLDRARLAGDLNSAEVKRTLERERQAALAFGVRATPSALINGQGLSGEPPEEQLQRLMARAQWQANGDRAGFGAGADSERLGIVRHHPEVTGAFDAMRRERHGAAAAAEKGLLGPRLRALPLAGDLATGDDVGDLNVVIFVDPAQSWSTAEASLLAKLTLPRSASRLTVRVLGNRGGEAASASLAALSELAERSNVVRNLLTAPGPWTAETVRQAVRVAGAESRWDRLLREPRLAVWLHGQAEQARHLKAQAGTVLVNGRRWLGRASDAGLAEAMAQEALELRQLAQGPSRAGVYAQQLAQGEWFSDQELDLGDPEDVEDLWQLPSIGGRGNRVVLLIDPGSLASRAAWTMLKRRPGDAKNPIVLHVGALPGKRDPQGLAMRALLAGASLRRLGEVVDGLLDAKSTAPLGAPWLAKLLGLPTASAAAAWQAADPGVAVASMRAVRRQVECGDEPVVFIASRLYRGPLEETRLVQATAADLPEPALRARRNAQ
ncbi:MAG: DsbA family protein [Deltaproteobacteria bacterium]|nr:DsbA family protein [Deltaproteobacteria bacterium]